MKNISKLFLSFGLFTGMVVSFVACKKADSEISYGIAKIYMPQAINLSAGINNNYPVPSGTDSTTYNYKIDVANKKLNVILGTSLSGEDVFIGYTVDVKVNTDTVNQLIANKTLDASTLLMPSSMYSLPAQVSVPAGVRGNTFYLSIDISQLKSLQYVGKKLALAVALSNPTVYPLQQSISTTIVIVNVASLNL